MAGNSAKLEVVQRFFSGTGLSYDRVVTLGTSGLDLYWKKRILAEIPRGATRILDQASGTGILSFGIARSFPASQVVGVELREEYLELARERARAEGIANVRFVLGRAEDVLLEEGLDCITSSYLAKYAELAPWLELALKMLRPGGVLVIHDFTYPTNPLYRLLWHGYLRGLELIGNRFYPEWGTVFRELPQFLQQSSWLPETLSCLQRTGFTRIDCRPLSFGTAALITARKPGA